MAAVAVMFAGPMSAQTWTPSEVGEGTFFIYNVGGSSFLSGGNSWGTQASLNAIGLDCYLALEDGAYSICTGNNVYLGKDGYIDKAQTNSNYITWNINSVGDNAYTLSFTTTETVDEIESEVTKYLVYSGEGTTCELTTDVPNSANGYWKFVTKEALLADANLSSASETNPVDVSFLVDGANFVRVADGEVNNPGAMTEATSGPWTYTISGNNFVVSGPSGSGQTNTGCEMWNNTFDLYQTAEVPNGYYYLTCDGFDSSDNAVLYGNDIEAKFTITSSGYETFANTLLNIADFKEGAKTGKITVTDGILKLGVKRTVTGWTVVDNIRLYYIGEITDPLAPYVEAYNTALEKANAVDQTAKMTASALSALQSAIAASVDETSQSSLQEATAALNNAVAAANKSIASYEVIAAGTIPDNSLTGWTCTNTNAFHINTWSVEGNAGNDPSGMVTPFIENWVAGGSFLGAGKVYYMLEGLEPGETYYASALVRSYNEASTDAPNGPDFFINDEVTSLSDAGETFTYNNMSGIYATLGGTATVGSDGILMLGVEIAEDRNYNWVAFKNVKIQDMTSLATELTDLVSKAKEIKDEKMNADVKTALETAIASYDGKSYSTFDDYNSAITAVKTAVENAEASVEVYEVIAGYNEKVDALTGDGVAEAYADALAAYNDGTATDAADAKAAYIEAVKLADPVADVTILAPTSWVGASGTVAAAFMKEEKYVGIAERFQGSMYTGDVMTQTIEGLKNGTYKVVLHGGASTTGARDGFEVKAGQNHAYFFANDALQSLEVYSRTVIGGENGPVETAELTCGVTDGVLKYGIQNITEGGNWFVVCLESIEYVSESLPGIDVTLEVTDAQYATFIAPFDAELPAGVKAYTVDGVEDYAEKTLSLTEITSIQANVPVVLYADSPVSQTLSGVSLAEGLSYTVGLLTGVYGELEITSGYVLQNQTATGVGFYYVDDTNAKTVPANHAYLTVPAGGSNDSEEFARAFFFPQGNATAINGLVTLMNGTAEGIYTADGKKVKSLQKGLNIIKAQNGDIRKIMVK